MRKAIPIEMDKIRNLRLGTNAITMAEDLLGWPITAISGRALGLKELRVLYYCALHWEDKDLTLDAVGDLMDLVIDEHGTEYLGEKIGEAIELALPESSQKKKVTKK